MVRVWPVYFALLLSIPASAEWASYCGLVVAARGDLFQVLAQFKAERLVHPDESSAAQYSLIVGGSIFKGHVPTVYVVNLG